MELGTLLILLLVLACPLMMVFMHRGGHGGHASHGEGHGHMQGVVDEVSDTRSLDELRSRRAELDAEIAQFEQSGTETKTPAVV